MKNLKSISVLPFGRAASLALMFAATVLPLAGVYATASGRQEPQSLTKEIRKMVTINYLIYLPKECDKDKGKRWPLILFLHGAGERGSDLNKLKAYGPPKLVSEGKEMALHHCLSAGSGGLHMGSGRS